jgi:putative ABC transport system permease protein
MAQTGNQNIYRAVIIAPEVANSLLHKSGRYDSLMVVVPSPDDVSTVQDEIRGNACLTGDVDGRKLKA